ncbi:unnamed protein product [Discosporangium mesarthrocarpum]
MGVGERAEGQQVGRSGPVRMPSRRRSRRGEEGFTPADGIVPTTTCKILVVGNAKCGKTSIIRRFVSDSFSSDYISTVGADYAMKDLSVGERERVRLQLWDIAGQDRFAKLTRAYFRRAKGAVVVCDVTREGTFEAVGQWKVEIDDWCQNEGCKLPVYLFANKSDLLDNVQDSFLAGAKMEKTCREAGFAGWYLTSAKRGDNVEAALEDLLSKALEAERERVSLSQAGDSSRTRGGREEPFELKRGGGRQFGGVEVGEGGHPCCA